MSADIIDFEPYRVARLARGGQAIRRKRITPDMLATADEYGRRRDAAAKGWARRRQRECAAARRLA